MVLAVGSKAYSLFRKLLASSHPRMLDVTELSKLAGIHRATVYCWLKDD